MSQTSVTPIRNANTNTLRTFSHLAAYLSTSCCCFFLRMFTARLQISQLSAKLFQTVVIKRNKPRRSSVQTVNQQCPQFLTRTAGFCEDEMIGICMYSMKINYKFKKNKDGAILLCNQSKPGNIDTCWTNSCSCFDLRVLAVRQRALAVNYIHSWQKNSQGASFNLHLLGQLNRYLISYYSVDNNTKCASNIPFQELYLQIL